MFVCGLGVTGSDEVSPSEAVRPEERASRPEETHLEEMDGISQRLSNSWAFQVEFPKGINWDEIDQQRERDEAVSGNRQTCVNWILCGRRRSRSDADKGRPGTLQAELWNG
jgi:hypothetical protein